MVVSNKIGIFTLNFGEDEPILTSIFFQNGLVQPPTRKRSAFLCHMC